MKKSVSIMVLISLILCAIAIFYQQAQLTQSCRLLNIASSEADLSPQWYIDAGKQLSLCSIKNALEDAEWRACKAQKRSGYSCESE